MLPAHKTHKSLTWVQRAPTSHSEATRDVKKVSHVTRAKCAPTLQGILDILEKKTSKTSRIYNYRNVFQQGVLEEVVFLLLFAYCVNQ